MPAGLGPRRPGPPRPGAVGGERPADPRRPAWPSGPPWPSTTSPACGRGTARSSSRWCGAAYDRGRRTRRRAAAARRVPAVGAGVDRFTPAPGGGRRRRARARPGAARHPPGDRGRAQRSRYRDRIAPRARRRRRRAAGSATTGSSTSSPTDDELRSTSGASLACWAWEEIELATHGRRRPVHRAAARPAGLPADASSACTGDREGGRGAAARPQRSGHARPRRACRPAPRHGRTARGARSGRRASR